MPHIVGGRNISHANMDIHGNPNPGYYIGADGLAHPMGGFPKPGGHSVAPSSTSSRRQTPRDTWEAARQNLSNVAGLIPAPNPNVWDPYSGGTPPATYTPPVIAPTPAAPPATGTFEINPTNQAMSNLLATAFTELDKRVKDQVAAGILTAEQAAWEKKKAEIELYPQGLLTNVDPGKVTDFIQGTATGMSFGLTTPVATPPAAPPPTTPAPPATPPTTPTPPAAPPTAPAAPPAAPPTVPPPAFGAGELQLLGGSKARELELTAARDAANAAYLKARLAFESEDAARGRALEAARMTVQGSQFNRQFALDAFQQLRGPANYGQLFNLYGGSPAAQGGLPGRFAAALSGQPIAQVPAFDAEAVRGLSFANMMPTLFDMQPQNETAAAAAAAVPTVDPRNVSPESFVRLLPSEQTALLSLGEAQGFPKEDFMAMLNAALPGGTAYPLSSSRVGPAGLTV